MFRPEKEGTISMIVVRLEYYSYCEGGTWYTFYTFGSNLIKNGYGSDRKSQKTMQYTKQPPLEDNNYLM